MELNDFQTQARHFVDYPVQIGPYASILSLSNNTGILSQKLYDTLKHIETPFTENEIKKMSITIGDILYDISNLCTDLGLTLDECAALNIRKRTIMKEKEIANMENKNKINKEQV